MTELYTNLRIPTLARAKTGVFAHVFYPELMSELIRAANNVPGNCTVYISTDGFMKARAQSKLLVAPSQNIHSRSVAFPIVVAISHRCWSVFAISFRKWITEFTYTPKCRFSIKRNSPHGDSISSEAT